MSKLESRLNRFPPFLCFALCFVKMPCLTPAEKLYRARRRNATKDLPSRHKLKPRRRHRRISIAEFAAKTGWTLRSAERLVAMSDWKGMKVGTMLQFLDACGWDIVYDCRELHKTLQSIGESKSKFSHLSGWQLRVLEKRIREWAKEI